MFGSGRFSRVLHGLWEYALGAFFVAAPFLFGFDSDAAVALGIIAGIALLIAAASSEQGPSLQRIVPNSFHVAFDLLLAGILIAAPFLFGFSDEGGATAFFIVFGVLHLLLTIGTRFARAEAGRATP